ncbi:MAG: ATP-binding cassette domain-containing protein [Bdellovibrionales bacterium]|nr:ATP-binding cassette domain-containing protein [Massilia sp.]
MASHVIEMRGVRKAFGEHKVIDGLSLTMPEHSIFAFLGNNGAGKSTAIRLITGLLRADAGEIEVLGLDVRKHRKAMLSQIGAIVDAPSLYPNLSAEEFLRIGCTIKGLPWHHIDRVLALVDLTAASGRLVAKFSLGMKQRLAIAHAMLGSPKLLILDEPTNGLDPEGMRDVRRLLKSLPGLTGASVFVSSHNLDEVEKMATHVALLKGGAVRFQASIAELLAAQAGALSIDVGDVARAQQLLSGACYTVERTESGRIKVSGIEKHNADRVHALLVHAGIRLYQSVYHTPSLEQWFMEKHHA